jgi:long-chain acyl-CoA synthetase
VNTLVDLLDEAAARYGQRVALTLEAEGAGEEWTYARLHAAAEAIAADLRGEHHIACGDRVVVWAASSPRLVALYFGCMRAGIIFVPIDPQSTVEFVARVAHQTEACAIVLDRERVAPVGMHAIALAELPDGAARSVHPVPAERPAPGDLAEVVFTSGTTGDPKGVMLTHANIVANVRSLDGLMPRGPHYRLLSLLPLSHMLEQTGGLYLPLSYGACISYLASRQPATIFKANAERQVTTMVVVPLVLDVMLRGIEREVRRAGAWRKWRAMHAIAARLPMPARRALFAPVRRQVGASLQFVVCGGARLRPELAEAWERMGIKVVEGYGATECSPVVAANTLSRRRFGTVGAAIRDVEVRIATDGELQVRGPSVTPGYWRHAEATAAAFTSDGWYRTGDLAEQRSNQDILLRGRLRDLIVLPTGMNVYPEDVEAAFADDDDVVDAMVMAVGDARGGSSVHAVLLPAGPARDGGELDARLAAAVKRANGRLAPHQRITSHSCWPGEDFPRTTSMKVKRTEVVARLAAQ